MLLGLLGLLLGLLGLLLMLLGMLGLLLMLLGMLGLLGLLGLLLMLLGMLGVKPLLTSWLLLGLHKTTKYWRSLMVAWNKDKMIDDLPAGLERTLLRVLSFHVGRENAISRGHLLRDVSTHGFKVKDRQLRIQINLCRKDGHAICSSGGVDGGYYMAADWDELDEFLSREVHSRAMDLLEQEKALKRAAEKRWGRYSPDKQRSFL